MKMKILIAAILLTALSVPSMAEQEVGDREFTLAGSGTSDDGIDNNAFGADASIGWFPSKAFEWGLRQDAALLDPENRSVTFNFATRVFADYHFDFQRWQPFVGGSFGAVYGKRVDDDFIIGPEAGFKYYVLPKTFVLGQASYQFEVGDSVDDGSTFYTLGLGFNF